MLVYASKLWSVLHTFEHIGGVKVKSDLVIDSQMRCCIVGGRRSCIVLGDFRIDHLQARNRCKDPCGSLLTQLDVSFLSRQSQVL